MTYSVLIVDDNITLANLYQIVFERVGWTVQMCIRDSDNLQALDLLPQLTDEVMATIEGVLGNKPEAPDSD